MSLSKEAKKQLKDQPAHAAWGLFTAGLPAVVWGFFPGSFVAHTVVVAGVVSCFVWTRRERLQFRDGAHEIDFIVDDPTLDNTVFWVFVLAGIFLPLNLM
jgi:hypothetical protein